MQKRFFATIFMARSGSKYLRSLLNQHPDLHDFGEIFHNRITSYPKAEDILMKACDVLLHPLQRVGIQFRFPRHFNEFPEIVSLLEKNAKWIDVIFLKRRNKLKGAISQQNAEMLKRETGKAHLFKSSDPMRISKLVLDVDRAIKEALDRDKLDEQFMSWVNRNFSTCEVYYEDLCRDVAGTINRILRFLQLNPMKNTFQEKSELVKITSDDLSEAIENYDELCAAVEKVNRLDWLDKPVKKKMNSKDRLIHSIDARLPEIRRSLQLEIQTFALRTNTAFLEHVPSSRIGSAPFEIVARQGDEVLTSVDRGQTWKAHSVGAIFDKCFTLKDGKRLLQGRDGTIYRFDEAWRLLDKTPTGAHPWHGSWSIDQNPETGTIIWCEYPYSAFDIRVWRSTDNGRSWSETFTQRGAPQNTKSGEIRHFHVAQHCSSKPGRWFLSSGDTEKQSKLWISEDDGLSWTHIPLGNIHGKPDDMPDKLIGRLHRFTAMIQTDTHIIYPTDDTFGRTGAVVCSIAKDNPADVYVFEGRCGVNEIRNFIKIGDDYGLVVSESKLDRSCVNLALADLTARRVYPLPSLPNEGEYKANFMNSISSRSAEEGVFFSFSDNYIFRPTPMILRWTARLV